MKIGCICVTERRAPIVGISLVSYLSQSVSGTNVQAHLCVITTPREVEAYTRECMRVRWKGGAVNPRLALDCGTIPFENEFVTDAIDLGCKALFDRYDCDVVTIWDDDDASQPNRLNCIALDFTRLLRTTSWPSSSPNAGGLVLGDRCGHFVNLRTLMGHTVETIPHLWGGTLTFNRAAWQQAGGFAGGPVPGYDRAFIDRCRNNGVAVSASLSTNPIAFSHGKNVATWLQRPGEDYEPYLKTVLAAPVFDEVKRAQQFLIDRRIFPPEP